MTIFMILLTQVKSISIKALTMVCDKLAHIGKRARSEKLLLFKLMLSTDIHQDYIIINLTTCLIHFNFNTGVMFCRKYRKNIKPQGV